MVADINMKNDVKNFSEKIATEDIKAEVEKTNSRLLFCVIVLFMVLIGFWVKCCASIPPEPDYSVECTKIGGQWVPEDFKITGSYTNKIAAYCSLKNKESNK